MSAESPLATFEGPDGAVVLVHDETTPYGYVNLFHVKLRVEARLRGGEVYETLLERLGVHEEVLASARSDMLENFRVSALPYVLRTDFPARLASRREARRSRVVAVFSVPS